MKSPIISLLLVFPMTAGADPADGWEFSVESGYLWQVGNNSDADYEIIPTLLTLRSPVVWTWWQDAEGREIVVRNRFTGIFEAFVDSPEDYYIGMAAAPSIEYVFAPGSSAFFSIGGGAGWTNSAGGPDGQGQDLAFNWFTHLGLRHWLRENLSLTGGIYFTHHSNLGMTDPNPGIDALGFTVGLGWRF
jgi:hypothetical protein